MWLTNSVIQLFLLVTWFAEYAFTLALKMTSSMTLIPYLLVAAYGLKLALTGETYLADPRERLRDACRGAVATVYSLGMIYAGGLKFVLLSAVLYAPGTLLFILARREQNRKMFKPVEGLIFSAIIAMALVGIFSLASGAITI